MILGSNEYVYLLLDILKSSERFDEKTNLHQRKKSVYQGSVYLIR